MLKNSSFVRTVLLMMIAFSGVGATETSLVAAQDQSSKAAATDSAALPSAIVKTNEIDALLRPVIERHAGDVCVSIRHLESGTEFHWRPDTPQPTASLIKLPVMIAAYRMAEAGELDLNKMVTLKDEDKVPGSGILTDHLSSGLSLSIRDAIRLMIRYSDNTATNLVIDQIGLPATTNMMEQLGFQDTKLHAKVFRGDTSIAPERSKQFGLGSTTSREMILLLQQLIENKLTTRRELRRFLTISLRVMTRRRSAVIFKGSQVRS